MLVSQTAWSNSFLCNLFSVGCEIDFKVEGSDEVKSIKCYTTRPDTLFGFSFLALSVDHPISDLYENNNEFINNKI